MEPRDNYRRENKDMYLMTEVTCPLCKKSYQKSISNDCPSCNIKIFEKDKDGWAVIVDPEKLDRSKQYTVKGLYNFETREMETKYFAGDVVMLNIPFVTDCTTYVYVDSSITYAKGFIMPEHDVEVNVDRVNDMMNRAGNTGFMGISMMNMMNMNGSMGMMGMMNNGMNMNNSINNVQSETDETLDPSEAKTCPMCKALSSKGSKFCSECGAKLE